MTKQKTIEELLDGRERRRMKAEDRYFDKLQRDYDKAVSLVGQLQGEKGLRYYVNLLTKAGRFTGKIKEFPNEGAACDYLIRNRYV